MLRGGAYADRAVQGTNDDASVSKMSCVRMGYFEDEFLTYFVRRQARRPPIINRGYFARVQAIRQLLGAFLKTFDAGSGTVDAQVLSVGAGWDTTYFRLKAGGMQPKRYVELDHKEVTASKCNCIKHNEALSGMVAADAEINVMGGALTSERYAILPCDLRDINAVDSAAKRAGLDPELPTLVLAECVLAYMEGGATEALLGWVGERFAECVVVIYDMHSPSDPFGQQLILNVQARGCPLPGIFHFPTIASHADLLRRHGFQTQGVSDMLAVYDSFLDKGEKLRAERIELLDEFEEWRLIMGHYLLSCGAKGPKASALLRETGVSIAAS